jgi:hypothetical protein
MSDRPQILTKYPSVEINGSEREMQPLTIEHVFDFGELVQEVLEKGQAKAKVTFAQELSSGQMNAAGLVGATIMQGVISSKERVVKFLASTINEKPEDYKKLPLGVTAKVVTGLLEHPDLTDFFAAVKSLNLNNLMESLTTTST